MHSLPRLNFHLHNAIGEHINPVENALSSRKHTDSRLQIKDVNFIQRTSIVLATLLSLENWTAITITLRLEEKRSHQQTIHSSGLS